MGDPRPPHGNLIAHIAQITSAGGRAANQDALNHALQDNLACFVVSDGVGGAEGGEVAARIVVEAIVDSFLDESSFGARALQCYVDAAITTVRRRKTENERLRNMSATAATVLIDLQNHCALWAHMGDTRIYLFRHGRILQATKDHSVVQQFVAAGYCTPDQLRVHPKRSTLLAAVGAEGDGLPEVTQASTTVEAGDAFLICTDGFWEWITELEMEAAASGAESAEAWLQSMKATVERKGLASVAPPDNFSAYTVCLTLPAAKADLANVVDQDWSQQNI